MKQYWLFLIFSLFLLSCSTEPSIDDQVYVEPIPPDPETDPKKIITIKLNKIGQVLIDDVPCDKDKIEIAYFEAHDKIGPETIVYLKVSQFALFETFMNIQEIIEIYAKTARENEADRSFHKHYDNLNTLQKQQIDKAHPINVVESKLD